MVKTKFACADRASAASGLDAVAQAFTDATVSREDGVHAAWSDRWVHVRTSNTEPIMRIIAEAPTRAEADELIARVSAIIHA
jgi:phosphomannomutase